MNYPRLPIIRKRGLNKGIDEQQLRMTAEKGHSEERYKEGKFFLLCYPQDSNGLANDNDIINMLKIRTTEGQLEASSRRKD
jgi:hypothetical protein